MTWIPSTTKIVDFAKQWLNNMLIPETTDLVLGEDDPGVTPIAIGSMGSASGQAFAYAENNLQYLHDIMVIDDVNINVSSVAQLQAALDVLDRVVFVHKDKTFSITIAAGTYAWPVPGTEPRSALHCFGVHGGGSVLFDCSAGVTIEGNGTTSRPLVEFMDCTCNLVIGGVCVLSNDLFGAARAVTFDNVRQVTALDFEVKNKASGNTLESAIYCREADFVDLGLTVNALAGLSVGINRAIYARQNSRIYFDSGNLIAGKLTDELIYLEKNSQVLFENLDSCLPDGADTGFYTQMVEKDQSSRILVHDVSSSGSGTSSSPFVITVPWEDATSTPRKINDIVELLPNPLDVWVKIKCPAGTMTQPIYIRDLEGTGGLILEANTVQSSKVTTQDTIIDNNDNALVIERCKVPVLIHSIKCDNETGQAAVVVNSSRDVRLYYCWLRAATGIGSSYYGNGVYVQGVASKILGAYTFIGTCNQNGVFSDLGASARLVDTSNEDLLNLPAQYGNFARNSGAIYRSNTGGKYIAGGVGIDSENEGGKVFNS
jgi:hypothetical protein